jgi:hypothetical protein
MEVSEYFFANHLLINNLPTIQENHYVLANYYYLYCFKIINTLDKINVTDNCPMKDLVNPPLYHSVYIGILF